MSGAADGTMSTVRTARASRAEAVAESPAYRLDDQVGFLLRRANQRHVAIFAQRMAAELTPTQWAVLAKLHEEGPTSQNLLGRNTAMDAATIKGVVDRLTARGLIETRGDPADGRRRVVALTQEGLRATEALLAQAAAITEETLAPLTPKERIQLVALLRKLG